LLLRKDVEFSANLGVVQRQEDVPLLDPVAVFDAQLLHDAAIEMLYALAVAFDLYDSFADDGRV
jgi:hypothetical protein